MLTPIRLFLIAGRGLICSILVSSPLALADGDARGALAPGAAVGRPGQPAAGEPGVWPKHEYSFVYQGFTSTYSCDGLADKLKILLITSGARPDAKARPGACASGFGQPDKFARADLTFYTLAPAGSDASAAAATTPGIWIPVAITARKPRDLGTGDCELVEQFKSSVLPMFTTRNVEDHTTCIPHQEAGSVIDLKFESFAAAPKSGHAPRTGPTP